MFSLVSYCISIRYLCIYDHTRLKIGLRERNFRTITNKRQRQKHQGKITYDPNGLRTYLPDIIP